MTDTPRTWVYLLTSEAQDGQPAGSYTLQRLRDFIVSVEGNLGVSVKQYGAAGDGSTDDTTAFNNAASSGAGTVYVPDGTYILNGASLGTANQTWIISKGATLKAKAGMTSGQAVLNPSANGITLTGGGQIIGNRANVTDSNGIVAGAGISDLTIDGLVMSNFHTNAINVTDPLARVVIKNCHLSDTLEQAAIFICTDPSATANAVDCAVVNNYVDGTSTDDTGAGFGGIVVQAISNSPHGFTRPVVSYNRVVMSTSSTRADVNCVIVGGDTTTNVCTGASVVGNVGIGGTMGMSFALCADSVFANNTIYSPTSIGMEITGCNGCVASGNVIDGNGVTATGFSIDQFTPTVSTTNFGNSIVGNVLRGVTGTSIHSDNSTDLAITGNTVTMSAASAQGIVANGALNISISGGSIDGNSASSTRGIVLDSTSARVSTAASITGVSVSNVGTALSIFASTAGTIDNIAVDGCNFATGNSGIFSSSTGGVATFGNNVQIMNCAGFISTNGTSNGNARRANLLDFANQVYDFIGSGSPASSVVAGPGSIYRNQAGGASTTLYVKESGTGNSGWIAK